MVKKNRDDFKEPTKLQIAKRAGFLCSYPTCRKPTVGATSDDEGVIAVGTAAHICGAAPGGPRYDERQTPEERSSVKNGIWMCRDHGTAIDSCDSRFTVEQLLQWKKQAEAESRQRVLREELVGIRSVTTDVLLSARLRAAAETDLKVFTKTVKWPSTSVELNLRVDGFNGPVTTRALALAVTSLDDLILVAPPGMGKTTTLFQIAEGILENGHGTPIVVPLGDWATESTTILESILKRPAFRGISEDNLREAAAQPGVVLLLDGWNELDSQTRSRARVQVNNLKAQMPELGLIISTRRQALDIPFEGMHIDLLPLDEDQQMQIAIAIRGDIGSKILDNALRTAGIRELITIPLYLTTLLSIPEDTPFPKTKEEVLRHFVTSHEKEVSRAETFQTLTQGFHQDFLESLAVFATRMANTAITDTNARRAIFETETHLVNNGQITNKTQPNDVLSLLVSNHMLVRMGDSLGYSFQHQQFQEWYASHAVERTVIAMVDNPTEGNELKKNILNFPQWEEAILFAVERLSRRGVDQQLACGKAIIAAFEVDPMLAAEMIFRSGEAVWETISSTIRGFVEHWHSRGKVDRAFRFMLTSGRPEFFDTIWPLITDENDQISLMALRNCRRFRPSILGKGAKRKIESLSSSVRKVLLQEMAMHGGIDGLDLASDIAKNDPDPEVQAEVVDVLVFRHAHRHVAEVLSKAGDATFDKIAAKGFIDEVDNDQVQKNIVAARKRRAATDSSPYDRLREIVNIPNDDQIRAELTNIISTMEINPRQDAEVRLIHEASGHYLDSVAKGILERVRAERTLFYGADDILASSGLALEDDSLLKIVLADPIIKDDRAEAAASVLGLKTVGRLVDAFLDVASRLRVNGRCDQETNEILIGLRTRIAHVPGPNLVAAVLARAAQSNNDQITQLAELILQHPNEERERGRSFDTVSLITIQHLVEDWGKRMLDSGDAKRSQTASIAKLASRAPSPTLLPILKRLLDDNLSRYRAFRTEAQASNWRQSEAVREAQWPRMNEYQHAFAAIEPSETATIMQEYLTEEHFGVHAAQVLAKQWRIVHEPPNDKRFFLDTDFSDVKEKRISRDVNPDVTSVEAEMIFTAIESLIQDGMTDQQKRLAVELGIIASRLPHGKRDSTIQKLIALAPRRARAKLLMNLVLSGEEIDIKIVERGISEILEAAKTERWVLTQSDGYELKSWFRLLPFVRHPIETLAIIRFIPPPQREPHFLEGMIKDFGNSPSVEAEDVLFKLAEEDPRFYSNYCWRTTVLRLRTYSSARRIVELTAMDTFVGKNIDDWHMARELGSLISTYPDLRAYVYTLLQDGPNSYGLKTLTHTVAESPDEDGLLLLVRFEKELKLGLVGRRTIERIVTEHEPAEDWEGAYNIVPIHASSLRKKLLSLTTDGGPDDAAARCLCLIDQYRDEYGMPETEPRHPDLASSKPWPILRPGPDLER